MSPEEKVYLSKEKHKELDAELAVLKTEKRKEIAEQLEFAKSLGDLSENAEYQEARENQATVEERISKIEGLLKHATIISERAKNAVNIGSSVTIKADGGKDELTWHIVGSEEADLAKQKISNESPLGSALMGKKVGETTPFTSPRGTTHYTIVKIT